MGIMPNTIYNTNKYISSQGYSKVSSFNNLYNARVEVKETAVYCRLLFWLQSPTRNFLDSIQNNKRKCNNIIKSCGLEG